MVGVTVLGSTGTIGVNTLDVIARHPDRFSVVALAARSDHARLFEQCLQHAPQIAVLVDEAAARTLRTRLAAAGARTEVLSGEKALDEVAAHPQTGVVMAGIVGAAGLMSAFAAARAGKRLLLANKEALVMAGELLIDAVAAGGAQLIPIDSEHNAIFQCLPATSVGGRRTAGVRRIILTASGGPFIDASQDRLERATPAEACAHPRWVMGRKISVDSATLMNKGLELIEACRLFGVAPEEVEVVIHRDSIIHSLVEYVDGSVLAELGHPDMRTPIAHALAWPERIVSGVQSLDLVGIGRLSFEAPDTARFPCLALAQQAARLGGTAPAVLNAANELAVQAFLGGEVNFTAIADVIGRVLERHEVGVVQSLDDVLAADAWGRRAATAALNERCGAVA
ncbi:MAG TPA: 1-deoxy-D-xylulose-5-phosphate reductoisomerase [Steroidobacteraceae bacterium]|nr:1-deoxy-D-xylulose-5-phosphate reductoisomerase [Steroidobacteraceae bacterium]